jgi:hypothetical protein
MKKISILKKMRKAAVIALSAMFLWSCEEVKDWHDPTDSVPPGALINIKVKNVNGGAWVYYSLPADNDLLGVRAEYAFEEGEELHNVFSSAFNDSILIEGYANTNEHTVNLYVIDKSHNESTPVQVTIKPLTPPVELLRQSLKLYTTFGGIYSEWTNKTETDMAIYVYIKDSIGNYTLHETCYSKTLNGKYTFREMRNTTQNFRIEIRDKWEHYATPLDTVMTPLFEEVIYGRDPVTLAGIWQRFGFDDRSCIYRGDTPGQSTESGRGFDRVYDGAAFQNSSWWMTGPNGNVLSDFVEGPENNYSILPVYFTLDMGRKASYSRLRYWMRSRSPYYSASTLASFELWGTNEPKPLNTIGNGSKEDNLKYWTQWPEVGGTDAWKNDWVKLADCVIRFPSGANPFTTAPVLTADDNAFIAAGFGFDIDPVHASEPFKYLRFVVRSMNNNHGGSQIQMTELMFWGAYAD